MPIIAQILHTAQLEFGDIANLAVADFCTGCGVFAIGASVMDAGHVVGFDIDPDALAICQQNAQNVGLEGCFDLVTIDLLAVSATNRLKFDTIFMNPPFGTKKNEGVDMNLLETAWVCAERAVYSLHKTTTREHILQRAKRKQMNCQVIATLKFDLPKSYKFHRKDSVNIEVDCFRFSRPSASL